MPQQHVTDMKIGALAEKTGLHVESIRYYQSLGLIPKPARAHGSVLVRRNTHPGRRPAPCRHHGRCNGCALMDMDLASQRELKRRDLERTWGVLVDKLVTLSGPGLGYRYSSKRVFASSMSSRTPLVASIAFAPGSW